MGGAWRLGECNADLTGTGEAQVALGVGALLTGQLKQVATHTPGAGRGDLRTHALGGVAVVDQEPQARDRQKEEVGVFVGHLPRRAQGELLYQGRGSVVVDLVAVLPAVERHRARGPDVHLEVIPLERDPVHMTPDRVGELVAVQHKALILG